MVDDAEGATKVSHIRVDRAPRATARRTGPPARWPTPCWSQCSLNGEDPYWGRVVSELGSAGVAFDMDKVSVAYGDIVVCAGGVAVAHDATAVAAHMAGRHIEIMCDLGLVLQNDGAGLQQGLQVGDDLRPAAGHRRDEFRRIALDGVGDGELDRRSTGFQFHRA